MLDVAPLRLVSLLEPIVMKLLEFAAPIGVNFESLTACVVFEADKSIMLLCRQLLFYLFASSILKLTSSLVLAFYRQSTAELYIPLLAGIKFL